MLAAIFTGYPRWKLRAEDLPADKIKTFPWIKTVLMAKWQFGWEHHWLDRELNWLAAEALESYAIARMPACDVFIALSGAGLKTSRVVKRRGARYICDRGSTHIRFGERILSEEFERWGQEFPKIDPRPMAKEEAEYEAADIITLPSSFCVRSFVELGVPASKLRKIPYGVELGRFRKVADPPADGFEVLFVGQVSFRKGVPYLLQAFEKLRHPRKRLRVVGAMQKEMRVFLQAHRFDRVDFLGAVPQAELVPLMSTSHVMVLPSIEDGLGLVLGQAMACGCPVICSTNTGGEELLSQNLREWIVPVRDPDAIAARLQRLCDEPDLRAQLSEAARRRVLGLGGWNDYGEQYSSLCRELAGQPLNSLATAKVSLACNA